MLSSQLREITCWFSGKHTISYIIPMYSGLESCLGASLEVQLYLPQSYSYHTQYKSLLRIPQGKPLLNLPQFQTPVDLDLSYQKSKHKTILKAIEVSPAQQQKQPELF